MAPCRFVYAKLLARNHARQAAGSGLLAFILCVFVRSSIAVVCLWQDVTGQLAWPFGLCVIALQ